MKDLVFVISGLLLVFFLILIPILESCDDDLNWETCYAICAKENNAKPYRAEYHTIGKFYTCFCFANPQEIRVNYEYFNRMRKEVKNK